MKKTRVGILCGGKSAEHEVSLASAQTVIQGLDKEKYEVIVIGIDQQGHWFLHDSEHLLQQTKLIHSGKQIGYALDNSRELVAFSEDTPKIPLDVIFPVLHGPYGEDGSIQGFLKLAGVPVVGSGVLGSAIGMDKDVMKRLLHEAGIPVAKFLVFHDYERKTIKFASLVKQLGLPIFIKPANLGSSIGINKVHNKKAFYQAVEEAFSYDRKIIIEKAIIGREIECSVVGNDKLKTSLPGEIIPHDEFYSYKAKYEDPNGATLCVPAHLTHQKTKEIQNLAMQTTKVLCAEGMARVDFFLTKEGKLYVDEINTIPGFTAISMYPKLWEVSGIPTTELLDNLITLAQERFTKEQQLKTTK